jgi:hypothetical protein
VDKKNRQADAEIKHEEQDSKNKPALKKQETLPRIIEMLECKKSEYGCNSGGQDYAGPVKNHRYFIRLRQRLVYIGFAHGF